MDILVPTRHERGARRISSYPPFFNPYPLLVHIQTHDFLPRWNGSLDSLMYHSHTRRAWLLFCYLPLSSLFFLRPSTSCATVHLLLFRFVDLVLVLGGLSMSRDLLYMMMLQYIPCWRNCLVLLHFLRWVIEPSGRLSDYQV